MTTSWVFVRDRVNVTILCKFMQFGVTLEIAGADNMAWSTGLKALCCAIVAVTLIIVLSVVMVIGKGSSVSVQGSDAHIQEISQVKLSLLEINNRVN